MFLMSRDALLLGIFDGGQRSSKMLRQTLPDSMCCAEEGRLTWGMRASLVKKGDTNMCSIESISRVGYCHPSTMSFEARSLPSRPALLYLSKLLLLPKAFCSNLSRKNNAAAPSPALLSPFLSSADHEGAPLQRPARASLPFRQLGSLPP